MEAEFDKRLGASGRYVVQIRWLAEREREREVALLHSLLCWCLILTVCDVQEGLWKDPTLGPDKSKDLNYQTTETLLIYYYVYIGRQRQTGGNTASPASTIIMPVSLYGPH